MGGGAGEGAWDPAQYRRFASARQKAGHDLVGLLEPAAGGSAVDLGCGTGELTVELHHRLGLARTLGIDSSPAMLAEAPADVEGIRFEIGDIAADPAELGGRTSVDVVFANASLQWAGDHPAVLARWVQLLRPGGQLAVQVPANAEHPSHVIAVELAGEEPFRSALDGDVPADPVRTVLRPAAYAELLHHLGVADPLVRLEVYGVELASTGEVVEWVRGTLLTRFRERLAADLYESFVEEYRERLLDVLGDRRPYYYAFPRILMAGRLAGAPGMSAPAPA